MKLTKCGTLVNKTTYLFTSMRDSNNSRGCAKILEFLGGEVGGGGKFWGLISEDPDGKGFIQQIPSMGVVWIFLEPHSVKVDVLLKRFHVNGYNIQYM